MYGSLRARVGTLVALSAMVQLEMPHVNILSKIDLLDSYGELPFQLDFFTEVSLAQP